MSKRISWKNKYQEAQNEIENAKKEIENLKGFQSAVEAQENKMAGFQQKIISIEKIHYVIAIAIALLTAIQIYFIIGQNDLIEIQNDLVTNQNYLMEAERRSSLVFLMSNVLDKVDEEVREQNLILKRPKVIELDSFGRPLPKYQYYLSNSLIARIVALSHAFRPYRVLDNGKLSQESTSPERGQLFIALMSIGLDSLTQNRIVAEGDFSYAKIGEINLQGAFLKNANLAYANLQGSNLAFANLAFANLVKAKLQGNVDYKMAYYLSYKNSFKGLQLKERYLSRSEALFYLENIRKFSYLNLEGAILDSVDLSNIRFHETNFTAATLRNCDLSNSIFKYAKIYGTYFLYSDFSDARGLENLEKAGCLYECKNLPHSVKTKILKHIPWLFTHPDSSDMRRRAISPHY